MGLAEMEVYERSVSQVNGSFRERHLLLRAANWVSCHTHSPRAHTLRLPTTK